MAEGEIGVDGVFMATADSGVGEIAFGGEFGDDALGGACGDASLLGDALETDGGAGTYSSILL